MGIGCYRLNVQRIGSQIYSLPSRSCQGSPLCIQTTAVQARERDRRQIEKGTKRQRDKGTKRKKDKERQRGIEHGKL